MRVETTDIPGVLVFRPHPHRDGRGFFSRTFDAAVARSAGIDPDAFVQDSQSRSHRGVVRGLHVRAGRGEAKLVRCSFGRVFDVVIDVRPGSPSHGRRVVTELDDESLAAVYVPAGLLHGWQALTEPADVCYRIDAVHDPRLDVTISHDDPALAVPWPLPPTGLSAADRAGLSLTDGLRPVTHRSRLVADIPGSPSHFPGALGGGRSTLYKRA